MGRVEAVIFAAAEPVTREVLTRVVGKACKLDPADRRHPRRAARSALRTGRDGRWLAFFAPGSATPRRSARAGVVNEPAADLSRREALVLMTVAYFSAGDARRAQSVLRHRGQPRHDRCAAPRGIDRRRPAQPAARRALRLCHHAGVSWRTSVSRSLRDLQDMEKLEDAGLLGQRGADAPGAPGSAVGQFGIACRASRGSRRGRWRRRSGGRRGPDGPQANFTT